MKNILLAAIVALFSISSFAQNIPLPEHPRPDFERADWENLNGEWQFTFNKELGQAAIQANATARLDKQINVPFGWGSPLSGVKNDGDKGFYARDIIVPETWKNKRTFLVIGAADYDTQIWFNGKLIKQHKGGYTPFEVELTKYITAYGNPQHLAIVVDDTPDSRRLTGKQGYGDVRGIWQTVYIEGRGQNFIDYVHFSPDIDKSVVNVEVGLNKSLGKRSSLRMKFTNGEEADYTFNPSAKEANDTTVRFAVDLHNQHLWNLYDPYLYDVQLSLIGNGAVQDAVSSYFGQRKVSVTKLPGTDYPYVALNNKPIYLQLTLDQSYNPEGYYTFPSDKFIRNEIEISKKLGLDGNRVHIKAEVPRKLYWADKLGLLIMQDVPNWWADDNSLGRADWEQCMREQVKRDYNHPSIFAWVDFNETWGLFTTNKDNGERSFLPVTQEWVDSMYHLNKKLDPTRLVEDMSACNHDHVEGDLNSWHGYMPGYSWEGMLDEACKQTYVGSTWNYIGGHKQNGAPMLNSECGNVWGYDNGQTGDVDITWDYHQMINAFRAHPKCSGWLYTEHHDVINEWNGYVRYDRSPKEFGLSDFVPGMTMRDFHSSYYVSPRCQLIQNVKADSVIAINRFLSVNTDKTDGKINIKTSIAGWDDLGNEVAEKIVKDENIAVHPWFNNEIAPVEITAPERNGLYTVRFVITGNDGQILGRNFTLLRVKDGKTANDEPNTRVLTFAPKSYSSQEWSQKAWTAMDGEKVDGAGNGFYEYTVSLPKDIKVNKAKSVSLLFEASAKRLNGKDKAGANANNDDFMRGKGSEDRSAFPNSYPQTSSEKFPSVLNVYVNGTLCGTISLPDDPADHRGALSWQSQKDKRLDEAGSYGYMESVGIPAMLLKKGKPIIIRFEVPGNSNGGVAIYGENAGHYPLNPTIKFEF